MAKTKKQPEGNETYNIVQMGGNIDGLFEKIAEARDSIVDLKKKRGEINAEIKAKREGMEALGITKKAFDLALSHFESSPEQREGFDDAYILAREGMGLKVKGAQLDMFNKDKKDQEDDNAEG